jgi:2-succinyl-5-enolpyruvyl-6-hydroxy-3-cyclohexene-1-carboxylate synthase
VQHPYTDERNAQILLSLLKAHGIRRIIASPGSANSPFVAGVQFDKFFEVYSSVDERSAAYLACGLAAETNEPVVISCTGATASRNYASGLTEAYYRKLPVLAVTSTQPISRVGHHIAQVVDRSVIPNDVARLSVTLPVVKDAEDEWDCTVKVNQAIMTLAAQGGGPAHINLQTSSQRTYTTKELPECRVIRQFGTADRLPDLPKGRIGVLVGAHRKWSGPSTAALENFCRSTGAVVFCDHTSGYRGRNRILFSLIGCQQYLDKAAFTPDLMIHIGEVTGDYPLLSIPGKQVWRVNPDGHARDTFRRLIAVFEMTPPEFFAAYTTPQTGDHGYFEECKATLAALRSVVPDLPLSNIYLASQLAHRLPGNAVIHFGILNSLRAWNLFELPATVESGSNVGGFGIDGCLSSLVGASLADRGRLFYAVLGDLAFFYDMNVLGNRHIQNNVRVLVVNNGKGTEFTQYSHHTSHFGRHADEYISAAGHYGKQSPTLVQHFAEDLGFEYVSATSKDELSKLQDRFLRPEITGRPMLFEVFTDSEDESAALQTMMTLHAKSGDALTTAKDVARSLIGQRGIDMLKKMTHK